MNSSSLYPESQPPSEPNPAADSSKPGKSAGFNPHEKGLTYRDVRFIFYMASLAIIPLIVALVLCNVLYHYYPSFDSLPKGAAPMGDVDENVRFLAPEEFSKNPE